MNHLHALTLASAKHLLNQGHITHQQHAGIVAKVGGAPAVKEMRGMESAAKRHKKPPVRGFGSLAGAQQAQAPIPSLGAGPGTVPPGTASGYED